MKDQKIYLRIKLLVLSALFAQIGITQPNWSVTPPDFQYTMTITGTAIFYCEETFDELDMVAAFVEGECRGVQHFGTAVNNRQLAYLTIYDNVPAGSEVTFKLYDASEDKIIDDVYKVAFLENEVLGNSVEPYLFQTDFPLTEMYLADTMIFDYTTAGTEIAQVVTVNANGDEFAFPIGFIDDSLGIDNDYFTSAEGALILTEDVDYINKSAYQIHIETISESGCSIEGVFNIEVINTNVPPTGIDTSDLVMDENEEIGSLVMTLIAIDESPNDVHVFELVGEAEEWPDHSSFYIQGNELLSNEVFDYETKSMYSIQLKVTDRVGNSVTLIVPISILDVIEFDDLKASNLVTPNEDGYNDFFEVPNVYLFEDYSLIIYNAIGNELYRIGRNYDNSWNGLNVNGEELPSGTYYFLLKDNSNASNQFVGDIHLYRENKF